MNDSAPRGNGNWAKPVERIKVEQVPEGAKAHNVDGRRLTGPLRGFGKLWQKTYRVRLDGADAGVTPAHVIDEWKRHYADFWPKQNRFYAPVTGIAPGEVGVIRSAQGPVRLSTGVMVLYADDESFTFITPEGHPFSGWITFSSYLEQGITVAQAHVQLRAGDPIFEMGMIFGGSRIEDRMWQHTLRSVAAHFGVDCPVETQIECLDKKRQWKHFGAIRHNAAIRGVLHGLGAPFRLIAKPFRRRSSNP